MQDFYKILGVKHSASQEEIRKAYKQLARKYHPDVNPGADSTNKFQKISEAYATLSDQERRATYDKNILKRSEKLSKSARRDKPSFAKPSFNRSSGQRSAFQKATSKKKIQTPSAPQFSFFSSIIEQAKRIVTQQKIKEAFSGSIKPKSSPAPQRFSVVEVSITVFEAIHGATKAIEIAEPEGRRKISITVPRGARTGDTIKLASKTSREEILAIIRLIPHAQIAIERKGVVVQLPVTVYEAYLGAAVQVPTLDGPVVVNIPSQSNSGTELRVKGKGILKKDQSRGDMFFRLVIQIPSFEAQVFKDAAAALEAGYENPPRSSLQSLFP